MKKTIDNIKFIMVQLNEDLDTKYEKATNTNDTKDIIKNQIELCDSLKKHHSLDVVGMERIIRESHNLRENTSSSFDYGFKHYTLIEKKSELLLDKLEKFSSTFATISQEDILNEFSYDSRLITFLCDDGYGLNIYNDEKYNIELAGYKAFYIDKTLYLLEKGFDIDQNVALAKFYNNGVNDINRIVVFGYAFDTRSLQQLKDNCEKFGISDKNIIMKY